MKYVLIGSHLDGNKGAASMLEAAVQTLRSADPTASFSLLSVYPEGDRALNEYESLDVLRADALYLGVVINSLALLYRLLPPLRRLLRRNLQIRAIAEADVFLDQGGITFVDGREIFLLYNLASILPALFIGTPVVKCSQAMGPFKGRLNRLCAKSVLPRIERILARGERSRQHLNELGLSNVDLVADYAFALDVTQLAAAEAQKALDGTGFSRESVNIGVFPSEVMRKKLAADGLSYEKLMVELIEKITLEFEACVYLIPHSIRRTEKRHNNDIPVCDDIYAALKDKSSCVYLKEITSAQQIRYAIGKMDCVVVARFHAMVSALATATPVFVTGWSHKYQEVLDMFNLSHSALHESDLSLDAAMRGIREMVERKEIIRAQISSALPAVQKSAALHCDAILSSAKES